MSRNLQIRRPEKFVWCPKPDDYQKTYLLDRIPWDLLCSIMIPILDIESSIALSHTAKRFRRCHEKFLFDKSVELSKDFKSKNLKCLLKIKLSQFNQLGSPIKAFSLWGEYLKLISSTIRYKECNDRENALLPCTLEEHQRCDYNLLRHLEEKRIEAEKDFLLRLPDFLAKVDTIFFLSRLTKPSFISVDKPLISQVIFERLIAILSDNQLEKLWQQVYTGYLKDHEFDTKDQISIMVGKLLPKFFYEDDEPQDWKKLFRALVINDRVVVIKSISSRFSFNERFINTIVHEHLSFLVGENTWTERCGKRIIPFKTLDYLINTWLIKGSKEARLIWTPRVYRWLSQHYPKL